MNESTPPPLPPAGGAAKPNLADGQPPDAPPEPVRGVMAAVEAVLREPRRVQHALGQPGGGAVAGSLLAVAVVCGAIYGVVAGTFSGGTQLWAAPLKIAGGLLASALICLPSLFIFATLGGANARVRDVFGILAGKLALTTILLVGFAPVAWVFSQSTGSVFWMGLLHLAFWAVSAFFGARFLHTAFQPMLRSGLGIKVWSLIYLLVALQMTTALRPILGTADTFFPTEKRFFLAHWFGVLEEAVKPDRSRRNE